jgi:hypothetical protein
VDELLPDVAATVDGSACLAFRTVPSGALAASFCFGLAVRCTFELAVEMRRSSSIACSVLVMVALLLGLLRQGVFQPAVQTVVDAFLAMAARV